MSRPLHSAILRSAAVIVPAPAREEWLAEWRAELWYVEHDATAFCLGSYRDALWLRAKSFSARRALRSDSPSRCILFLAGLTALTLSLAELSHSLPVPAWSEVKQLPAASFWMYAESLLVLSTLDPLAQSEPPSNGDKRSVSIRLRWWGFLAGKITLLPPIMFFVTVSVAAIFPPAVGILLVGLIFGFRWALADQRRRCPVCLHLLSNPIEIGNAAHTLFRPYGTELSCSQGHGPFHVPGTATSWCTTQESQLSD
jgi:hypothetical protein